MPSGLELIVAVDLHEFSWGAIGVFVDPDGNRCELKNAGA